MKTNRFLWMMMVALLVPAMALSGCDKKKVNRDDDSSSGSSDSTEKSEEKKESKDESYTISGRYEQELDKDKKADFAEGLAQVFEIEDYSDFDVKCYADYDDDDELNGEIVAKYIINVPDIDNNMVVSFKIIVDGDWKYNKKDKSLLENIKDVEISDVYVDFEYYNEATQFMLDQIGGKEVLEQNIEQKFKSRFSRIDHELKRSSKDIVLDLDENGFTTKTKEGKKCRYTKV